MPGVDFADDALERGRRAPTRSCSSPSGPSSRELDLGAVAAAMRGTLVVDGRNVLDPEAVRGGRARPTRASGERAAGRTMQALILVGGEGTRLRPLTSTVPKPVVPLVDRPFIAYMLEWLRAPRRRRRRHVVRLPGHRRAQRARRRLAATGCGCATSRSPSRCGTGGALKYAEDLLDERFLMLNGDVLTDIDLTAQLAQHERTGARGTLALIAGRDPSAYGLVRLRRRPRGHGVRREAERRPDRHATSSPPAPTCSSAPCSTSIPAERNVSIEREVFPQLVGDGLYGYAADGLLARHRDARALPAGHVRHPRGQRRARPWPSGWAPATWPSSERVEADGRIVPPALVERGCTIAAGAHVGALRRARRAASTVGRGHARSSARSCSTAPRSAPNCVLRDCIVGRRRAHRRQHATISGGAVLGEGVTVGDAQRPRRAACESSPTDLPEGAITF